MLLELTKRELELIELSIRQYRNVFTSHPLRPWGIEAISIDPVVPELDRLRDRISNRIELLEDASS